MLRVASARQRKARPLTSEQQNLPLRCPGDDVTTRRHCRGVHRSMEYERCPQKTKLDKVGCRVVEGQTCPAMPLHSRLSAQIGAPWGRTTRIGVFATAVKWRVQRELGGGGFFVFGGPSFGGGCSALSQVGDETIPARHNDSVRSVPGHRATMPGLAFQ